MMSGSHGPCCDSNEGESSVRPESEASTWRQLLATLIDDPDERRRISTASGIDDVTLKRYADNKTKKIRPHMLRLLVAAVPQQRRSQLITLIQLEFADISFSEFLPITGDEPQEALGRVQLEVYERVIHARATTPLALRFWVISNLVLNALLEQLDPGSHPVGVKVTFIQCIRCDRMSLVKYLREIALVGSGPWKTEQLLPLFLGAESLPGYAITSGRPAICQNLRANAAFLPVRLEAHAESSVAFPLLQGERVGGCLCVVAAAVDFFSPAWLSLIGTLADLAGLALQDDQFHDKQAIQLRVMPPDDVQQSHFVRFRSRVHEMISTPARDSATINIVEAERIVWGQIAEDLMNVN